MNKEENIYKRMFWNSKHEMDQEDFKINVRTEIFHKLGFIKGYVGKGDDMKEVRDRVKEIEELVRKL